MACSLHLRQSDVGSSRFDIFGGETTARSETLNEKTARVLECTSLNSHLRFCTGPDYDFSGEARLSLEMVEMEGQA
jgi:hypothetical protein